MRLICGILKLDGTEAADDRLGDMVDQMDVPRLKPSLALWREGPVGLAMLDFSAHGETALPEQGAVVMAGDVRLDEPAAGPEDAQLLGAALQGPDVLAKLLGDFAFACWDRDTQSLTCGRDGFGIRPFSYVYQPGKFFAFASLPAALHGSGIVPKILDKDALARRMVRTLRFDDSLIAGIRRLPPAHLLTVSRAGMSLERYWQLDRERVGSHKCTPQDAARELRRLVDQAVTCRLPRHGAVGAHLSGGLDSSAISVLAARRLRQDGRVLHAYSFLDRPRNDIALEDETAFVKAVVEQESDIDWTPIPPPARLHGQGEARDPDKMTSLDADDPENAVCARAEAQGVGLILSGWGGDEAATFNGRGTFAELFLRGRWRILRREIAALKSARGWSAARIVRQEIVSYVLPRPLIGLAKSLVNNARDLKDRFPQSLTAAARQRLAKDKDQHLQMAPDGRENRWRLITGAHIAERTEVWAQTGARHGLAFAFPLLDRRVVEFALSLPSALFLRDGYRRRPFRDAMSGVLPEMVRLRHAKYMPFPGRLLDMADSRRDIQDRIESYMTHDSICDVIDLKKLRRNLDAFPAPDVARNEMQGGDNPKAAPVMIATVMALAAAEHIAQHGSAQN